MSKLRRAVEHWVKCEWAFRLGPGAYQKAETDRYLRAEARLRRALVQRGDLGDAFKRLKGGTR